MRRAMLIVRVMMRLAAMELAGMARTLTADDIVVAVFIAVVVARVITMYNIFAKLHHVCQQTNDHAHAHFSTATHRVVQNSISIYTHYPSYCTGALKHYHHQKSPTASTSPLSFSVASSCFFQPQNNQSTLTYHRPTTTTCMHCLKQSPATS